MLDPIDQQPARHHRLLIHELQAVAAGETDRLMIFMPPGSAKTTYASRIFPAWMLGQAEGLDMIGTSYNSEYAEGISEDVQAVANEWAGVLGYRIKSGNRRLWRTDQRGRYRAAGAGSGITGRRADLVVIDDPIKGREQADSTTLREKVWKWYRAEVYTRLKPGARIVLIQTRWHEDDLAGRLLSEMEAGADQWRVIDLPALAEAGREDVLGRAPGEALWPEWEDEAALARKQRTVGPREWSALYQQRPAPPEGTLFKTERIAILPAAPVHGRAVRAWDLAATESVAGGQPDWTVGVKLMRESPGRFVITDVVRLRGSPRDVDAAIKSTAIRDGKGVAIGLPQDPGQAGKYQAAYFSNMLAGYTLEVSPETGSKTTRAIPVASQVEVGNFAFVKAPWNTALIDELGMFPAGRHDDQVDALSRAFGMLTGKGWFARIPDQLMIAAGVAP